MCGSLVMSAVKEYGVKLLPVDSEISAILQCLSGCLSDNQKRNQINRLILTASGGPFRETPLDQLHSVTPSTGAETSYLEHGEQNHN